MNPTLRRVFGTVAAGVALTGSLAFAPLAAGAESAPTAVSTTASATSARTQAENERIVQAMYQGFLKRDPNATELAAGLTKATAGEFKSLVGDVSRGSEWLGVFVDDLYDQALERKPDAAGRTYWIGELASGKASTLIAASVIGSPEFRALAGNTDDGFIERNYVRILDRASEPTGKAFWLGILGSTSDAKIGSEFFESLENRTRRVTNQYQQLLCRAPETAGRDYWAGVITGGKDVALSEELATSDEFIANAVAGKCLTTIPVVTPPGPPDPVAFCADVNSMPTNNCEALVKIYNANGGSTWVKTQDNRDYPGTWTKTSNPCTWAGVECLNGKMTALSLNAAGVTGALDPSLANLTDLVTLNVSGNEISALPTTFAAGMTGLRFVNISYNNLTSIGDLSAATKMSVLTATQAGISTLDVSAMADLEELYINNNPSNNVDGTKNAFTALPLPTATNKLTRIEAQYNQITDITGVDAQVTLTRLWLFNNRIATIPAEIQALTGLTDDATPTPTDSNAANALIVGPQCAGAGNDQATTLADATDATFIEAKDDAWDTAGALNGAVCTGL